MKNQQYLYGLLAEFDDEERLIAAVRLVRQSGYRKFDAFSPHPVEGLAEALGARRTWIPLIALLGGLAGAAAGYLLQFYVSVIDYPLNVGGRPYHSWPAFIPVTFETMILGAALATVVGMFVLNGLPMPYHPVFNVPGFVRASHDGFFLLIEAVDPQFDLSRTRQFLLELGPRQVSDVPH